MPIVRTAEAVCVGHPDKLCDLIADQILDDILWEDKSARVAVEVLAAGRTITVAGEITTTCRPHIRDSVRDGLRQAGYEPAKFRIRLRVRHQSPDIGAGVTTSLEARQGDESAFALQGAGDQGTVYGYATSETKEMLPLPLVLAHDICRRLDRARKDGVIKGIKPDGKAQVSITYDSAGRAVEICAVVASVHHDEGKDLEELAREVKTLVIAPTCQQHLPIAQNAHVLVNPSGKFTIGGPTADTGLTGRKLAVDTYGGLAAHGGGAFSGKDASKVDRSAAYMARLIAKTIVAADLAEEATVAISYAIGKADPVAFSVDTAGSGLYADTLLTRAASAMFPLRPAAIIDALDLRRPGFSRFSTYGHFGGASTWENEFKYTRELEKAVNQIADQDATGW